MLSFAAWMLFALGLAHVEFGLVKFRVPLAEVVAAGFVARFKTSELRRTAFWFILFGPLLMAAGHAAIHAVAVGDLVLIQIIGTYALVISAIGLAAFPKSPFIAAFGVSLLLIAAGYGWTGFAG